MPGLHYPEFFRVLDPGTGSAGRPSIGLSVATLEKATDLMPSLEIMGLL